MAADFQDYVQVPECGKPEIRTSVVLMSRVYVIPAGSEALIPAKGSAISLRSLTDPTLTETGTGLAAWRILNVAQKKDPKGWRVGVTFYQVRLFPGETNELVGSRKWSMDGRMSRASRILVSVDGLTGVPNERDFFPGDSGILGRKCISVRIDPEEPYPGLYSHVAQYAAFREYAS
jgi:hypothetical protein